MVTLFCAKPLLGDSVQRAVPPLLNLMRNLMSSRITRCDEICVQVLKEPGR